MKLTPEQRDHLTEMGYQESETKPGLWYHHNTFWSFYIDLRNGTNRAYKFPKDGGPSEPGDNALLRRVLALAPRDGTKQERLF